MKKWLSIAAASASLLVASTAMFAHGATQAPVANGNAFNGAYFGFEGGAMSADFSYRFRDQTNGAGVGQRSGNTDGTLGVFGGYGHVFGNRWYLGGELEANMGSTGSNAGNINGTTNYNAQVQNQYAAYLVPGFLIDPHALVFMMAGYALTNLELTLRGPVTALRGSSAKHEGGPSFGVGLEAMVRPGVFVRALYKFTFLCNGISKTVGQVPTDFNTVSIGSPFMSMALIGLSFRIQ